jgi:hypothetical protein
MMRMITRRSGRLALGILAILTALGGAARTIAQAPPLARTHYAVTVYSEPRRASTIVGVLPPRAEVALEARGADTAWVLGRSVDGAARGWIESRFLDIGSADLLALPVSGERIYAPGWMRAPGAGAIDLSAYPLVPAITDRARAIFARGQALGLDPRAISKIGDCISDNRHFLSPFGWGDYNLGGNTALQPVIDHFAESLASDSLAAYDGLVTSATLDPLFANPLACLPGETPLRCEYRVRQSSFAIIMFGAQDLLFANPDEFDRNLHQIVHETIEAGVVPILSTFPGNLDRWDDAIILNRVVVQIALDYDIPLMNLWRALDGLPNHGLESDGRHLSPPVTHSGDLTGENLRRGYPLRNLVTLQALDSVWRAVQG